MGRTRFAIGELLAASGSGRRVVVMVALAVVLAAGLVLASVMILLQVRPNIDNMRLMVRSEVFKRMGTNGFVGRRDVWWVVAEKRGELSQQELEPLGLSAFARAAIPGQIGGDETGVSHVGLPMWCAIQTECFDRATGLLVKEGVREVPMAGVRWLVPTLISWPRFAANVAMLTPFTFAGIVLVVFAAGRARRAWRRRAGRCTACGYDTRGLSKCPECGAATPGAIPVPSAAR
jgi:hypothetical protein